MTETTIKPTDADFKQLVPVNHEIHAVYLEDDGTEFFSPVIFAALTNAGYMVLIDTDPNGEFYDCTDTRNFLRYHYGPKPKEVVDGEKEV